MADIEIGDLTKNLNALLNKFSKISENIDSANDEDADKILNDMTKELGDITQVVGTKVKEMTDSIVQNNDFSPDDKKQYLDITDKIGKLTTAINQMEKDPEGAEKSLNDIMSSFRDNMSSLTKPRTPALPQLETDSEERINELEIRIGKLERKIDKLKEIVEKLVAKIMK